MAIARLNSNSLTMDGHLSSPRTVISRTAGSLAFFQFCCVVPIDWRLPEKNFSEMVDNCRAVSKFGELRNTHRDSRVVNTLRGCRTFSTSHELPTFSGAQ